MPDETLPSERDVAMNAATAYGQVRAASKVEIEAYGQDFLKVMLRDAFRDGAKWQAELGTPLQRAAVELCERDFEHRALLLVEHEFGLKSGNDTKAAFQALVDARRKYDDEKRKLRPETGGKGE